MKLKDIVLVGSCGMEGMWELSENAGELSRFNEGRKGIDVSVEIRLFSLVGQAAMCFNRKTKLIWCSINPACGDFGRR